MQPLLLPPPLPPTTHPNVSSICHAYSIIAALQILFTSIMQDIKEIVWTSYQSTINVLLPPGNNTKGDSHDKRVSIFFNITELLGAFDSHIYRSTHLTHFIRGLPLSTPPSAYMVQIILVLILSFILCMGSVHLHTVNPTSTHYVFWVGGM